MLRCAFIISMVILYAFNISGYAHNAIVADYATRKPLPNATVFDRQGSVIGICNSKGKTPYISDIDYPVTVRYLGYEEKTFDTTLHDTIFLKEIFTELPEVIVQSRRHKVLHMLAYIREYSTLTTYTDTVFLFREKMADYMLPPDRKMRFKGWSGPRTLNSKSYYRFTDSKGTDSVSDKCSYHFSWSDWIGAVTTPRIPPRLKSVDYGTDTLRGKYSPTEVWLRNNGRVTVDVNVLADTTSRKWVPNLSVFFRNRLDFENFRIRFNYSNVVGDSISPMDITGYSFNIESNGRGHEMFMFNPINEPFFVSTYAEVYIIDKEYITTNDAKKWERLKFDPAAIEIIEPADAPQLQAPVQELIARVNTIRHDNVRLNFTPDHRLAGRGVRRQNIGQRALVLLKQLTGITYFKSHRNLNKRWSEFRKENVQKNNSHTDNKP